MVAESDILDYLPYIDQPVPHDQMAAAEALVADELRHTDTSALHPRVEELLPLSLLRPASLLSGEIERYEEEHPDDDEPIVQGMDFSRYDDAPSHMNLSYAMLEGRNLKLMAHNMPNRGYDQLIELYCDVASVYAEASGDKRRRSEEVLSERKRRQLEFEPVGEYLEGRWRDGIRSMVNMGMEH